MSVQLNQTSTSSSIKTTSLLSQSESVASLDEDARTQQFEESYIFPLFSEISRVVVLPSIFCFLQFLIQAWQSLAANMYIGNRHIWNSISSTPKVLRILSYIVNFGIIDFMNKNNIYEDDSFISTDDFFNCYPCYVTAVAYFAFEIFFLIYILYWYRKKRSFMKWSLYVAFFLLSVLNPIIFTPICGIAGYALWQIDFLQSNSSIAYFVISIIPALLILTFTIWDTNFTCHSVYISRNIDASWDPRIKNWFTITIGLTSFLGPALNPFPRWFVLVGIIIGIALNFYQLYLMYYLPFIKFFMNSVLESICWLSITGLILSIVNCYKDLSNIVLIIVPIAVFIVFCILYLFADHFKIKKALKKLNLDQADYSEQDKKNFLESINLGSNSMAIFLVRIGISHLSPLCVDFSLIKYIANIRQTPKIFFPLIHLTAMIPAQMQFLSQLISVVNKSGTIFTIIQSYILYQARKVHVIRQSVSSKEERSEAKLLYKMSEETISLVRGFWGEISHTKSNISTASLRYFRNSSMRTSSSYLDALDQFPRSQKIFDQYIRFLIEAMGDYKSSIHYSKHLRMIEKGHRVVHDHAFLSFANTFPRYLTQNILDCHGMYVNDNGTQNQMLGMNQATELLSNTNTNTNTNSITSDSISDIRNNDIASDIFKHSKLRLALQEVIDKSSMKSLNVLRGFSVTSLFLILICFIVLILASKSTVDSPYELMISNTLTSKLANSIEYASLSVATRLLEYTSQNANLGPLLASQLSINASDLPNFPSVFNQPFLKLNMLYEEIRGQLHEVLDIVFSNPSKHLGEIRTFGHWEQTDFIEFYYDLTIARMSLRGGINLFLNQIYEISSLEKVGLTDQKSIQLCITNCFNGYLIAKNIDDLFANVSQTGIDECEKYSNLYDILTYVISIVAGILFFIFRIVNFFFVKKEFNTLSSLLRGFSKEDMEASSKPIYLKSKEKLPTGTVHSAHDFSIEVFIIPFIFLLITADCIFVVVYTGLLNQDFFDSMADAFEWSSSGAQRALTLMKLMIGVTIDHSSMSVLLGKSTNESTGRIQENIDIITSFQNKLDIEIIGKDDRFDTFYYTDRCEHIEGRYNYANFIDCISLSNKINLAMSYFNMMRKSYELNQIFFTFEFAGISYSIDKSIYNEFISFQEYLLTYADNISNEHIKSIQLICIVGIVILIVLFVFENFFINMLYNSFAGFKQLIYSLPPVSVCQNRALIDFLSRMKRKEELLLESELVINSSNMGIIMLNENLIIQTINPAFIKMTGIPSHKLLGQSITFLIPLPADEKGNVMLDKSLFYVAVEELRKDMSCSSRTVKIKLRKQDFQMIHTSSTLIKLVDENNGNFKGITIMMKSIEETVKLKKKLLKEKENTQHLLDVLVPKGAMSSVKGKKQPVLFKADIATVMFIEITGISECISMMPPKGLMDILEQIYNNINETLKKYDSISMMRWENEIIFAVSGLFSYLGDYQKQVTDTASFLIDITRQLEEINIQFSTDFHMRTGAHIGGPVMGFVQNPDVPCFNIRTPSFKFTNHLKEMECIDQVQLTGSTVKYLDMSVFDIEKSSTFDYEGGCEEVFVVRFKDGFRSQMVSASRLEDDKKIELHDNENINQKEEEDIIDGNDVTNQE